MNDLATILTLVVPLLVAAIVPLLLGRMLPKRPADAAVRATQAEAAAKLAPTSAKEFDATL